MDAGNGQTRIRSNRVGCACTREVANIHGKTDKFRVAQFSAFV